MFHRENFCFSPRGPRAEFEYSTHSHFCAGLPTEEEDEDDDEDEDEEEEDEEEEDAVPPTAEGIMDGNRKFDGPSGGPSAPPTPPPVVGLID